MATKAQHWLEVIDRPKATGHFDAVNKGAVKRMMDAAVEVLQEASGRCTEIYIFSDGSSLYEKRKGSWYPEDIFVKCPECDTWRRETEACEVCAEE